MKEPNYTREEIEQVGESYINGNISWVKKAIDKRQKLFIEVCYYIYDIYGTEKMFKFMDIIHRGL